MVLAHVAAHGRITRREAAELCQITRRQATALLKEADRPWRTQSPGGAARGLL